MGRVKLISRKAEFQSSPALKDRCNATHGVAYQVIYSVSILTGLERPVQPVHPWRSGRETRVFQSSPALKDRCNFTRPPAFYFLTGFQSSPALKDRCNELFTKEEFEADALFQSSPALKDRCNFYGGRGAPRFSCVSILTGLERPVQQPPSGLSGHIPLRFNPHRP